MVWAHVHQYCNLCTSRNHSIKHDEQIGGGLENRLVGVTHECDHPPAVVAGCERVTTSEINPHKMSQVRHRTFLYSY